MKAIFRISDNKLIEAQSNASSDTLITNAIRYGYDITDMEVRDITDSELKILLASETPAVFDRDTMDQWLIDNILADATSQHFGILNRAMDKNTPDAYAKLQAAANKVTGGAALLAPILAKLAECNANLGGGE